MAIGVQVPMNIHVPRDISRREVTEHPGERGI